MPKNTVKYFLVMVLVLALSFSLSGLALINTAGADLTPEARGESFNIENLRAGEDHEMSYFNDGGGTPVAKFIIQIVNFLSSLIGTVALLMIIVGGLIWITGGGNENQVSKGKDTIVYAIIGLLVAFSAYILTAFVQSIFYPVEEGGETALILFDLL